MKNTITLFLLLFIFQISSAQKPKFKKVTKEELSKTNSDIDPDASAEYLYNGCEIEFVYNESRDRFEVVYNYQQRIKIYKEDGYKYGDFILSFYKGQKGKESEKIKNIEAYTFNLVGGKVEKKKLDKKSIYEEEKNKFYDLKKFAMPAIQDGSVLEVKYKLVSPYYFRMDEFYFQKDIPVKYAEFRSSAPKYFNYNYNLKGIFPLKMEREKSENKINYTVVIDNSTKNTVNRKREQRSIIYTSENRHYFGSDIPAIIDEPFVYTIDNYKNSIKMELLFTNIPNVPAKYYTQSWNEIAKNLNERKSFGGQLKKSYDDLIGIVNKTKDMNESEKIASIYFDVQNKYSWNGYTSSSTDKGIKNLIKEGSGNTAEINLLLVNLLREAGISAHPIVSRKKTSGFLNINNPSLADLNYVTALVKTESENIILDATQKFLPPNMLPSRALNLKGIVLVGETASEIPLPNNNKGNVSQVYNLAVKDDNLVGSYKNIYKEYSAYILRNKYSDEEKYKTSMSTDEVVFSEAVVSDFNKVFSPIKSEAKVKISNKVQNIDDKIFIDLLLDKEEFINPLKSETRNFALFFDSVNKYTDIYKIDIPEGYQVESLPETLNIAIPEMIVKYLIKTTIVNNQIMITVISSLNNSVINPAYYEPLKDVYNQVEAKFKEKIVLSKI